MAGWDTLGSVLGGGIDREGKYQEGRYRSAQTEAALASARENQMKATQAEKMLQLQQDWTAAPPDFANPDNALIGQLISNKLGSDFSATQTGVNTGQNTRLRGQIADPATSYDTIQRLRAAVGDAAFNPIDAVGTHGAFIDTRAPNSAVQPPDPALGDAFGMDENATPAIKNFEYDRARGGTTPFPAFVRNEQVIMAGGVPMSTGFGGTAPAKEVVDAATVAKNTGAVAGARAGGTATGKAAQILPGRLNEMGNMRTQITNLLAAPGFDSIYGKSSLNPFNKVPGSDAAIASGRLRNIDAKSFGISVQSMRGLGQLSNAEGSKVQAAFTRANDPNISEEEARMAWQETLQSIARLEKVAKQEAGMSDEEAGRTSLPADDTAPTGGAYSDPDKEARYQAWKQAQGSAQ